MISWFVGVFAGVLLLDFVVRKLVSLYIEVKNMLNRK
ncbi:hypothetical protein [Gardnerella phage vB_Gva_AB1]|nr:hypothetical protein [Gardnerella phage vB_Gva_AB1]DAO79009.1 MAG TPA: hypothetical protein [Caudoviricetes sp.]